MSDKSRQNQISVGVAFVIFASGLYLWLADSDPLRPLGLPRSVAFAVAALGLFAFVWVVVRRPPSH